MRKLITRTVLLVIFVCQVLTSSNALETGDLLLSDIGNKWLGDYDGMLKRRKIRVLIPYSKTFFFLDGGKQRGLAVEWLREFEKTIHKEVGSKKNWPVIFLIPTRRDLILSNLVEGRGDIAIANLTVTDKRKKSVAFSKPFKSNISEILITPSSHADLNSKHDLAGLAVHVRESSSYFESLKQLNLELMKQDKPQINIVKAEKSFEDEDLLEMVNAELLPAIIIDSHKAAFWGKIFNNIKVHGNVQVRTGGKIAWAFRKNSPILKSKIDKFADKASKGTLLGNIILNRYYRDVKWLSKATSASNIAKLNKFAAQFKKYGNQYKIDWLLLAALAFQESRLDQSAKGPKGAVGIMQIKPSTAASSAVNIPNISDVEANISAGAKYMRYLADKYYAEKEIDGFNRILFTLASYNAGPNRIASLRNKTKNSHIWFDNVEDTVSRHVGFITVHYVLNIYQYYVTFKKLQSGPE